MNKRDTLEYFIPISRKLFDHQYWCEEREFSRFEAWIYLLKEARFEDTKLYEGNKVINIKRGQVYSSIRFLAKAFGWSTKKLLGFLNLLISDKMIKKETLKETGQTVITICNYDKYNKIAEKRKREKKHEGNSKETKYNKDINKDNNNIPPYSPPVGDDEDDVNWRDDFDVYLNHLRQNYTLLVNDSKFIAEREKYHPGVNIRLSLEKSCVEFWATKAGWKNKKSRKTVNIDWKMTFVKALNQKQNQVWKTKEVQYEERKNKPIIIE